MRNCLNCVHNCDDHGLLDFKIRSSIYETFHISLHNVFLVITTDLTFPKMELLKKVLNLKNRKKVFSRGVEMWKLSDEIALLNLLRHVI